MSHQTRVRFQKDSLMEQETNRDGQLREEQMRRGIEGRKEGRKDFLCQQLPLTVAVLSAYLSRLI